MRDSFRVDTSSSRVWELFWDFPRLASCLPGCEAIEVIDDSNLKARVKQIIGSFQEPMELMMTIVDVTQGRRIVAEGGGSDRKGNRLKIIRASLAVDPISPGETQVSYDMNFTLFGRLGTLGYGVIKRKVGEMQAEFTRCITAALENSQEVWLGCFTPYQERPAYEYGWPRGYEFGSISKNLQLRQAL